MIAFVYEPAALRYSPERKNSFPSSFMVASSSGRAGISMAADTMVGPSLLCAPLGTDERHLVNFFSNFPAGGPGESRTSSNRVEPTCNLFREHFFYRLRSFCYVFQSDPIRQFPI